MYHETIIFKHVYKISPLGIKGSGDPPIPKGTMPRPLTENLSIATFPLLENNNCSSPFFKNNLMKSMDFDNFYLKGRGINMPRPLTENVSIATFPLLENNNCSSTCSKKNI